ncbi:hypothetical protein [Catellatospora vulcania]|uniref:hypothetical protein n=1 Tax=Catellatospora vulcania TaxID=1460450 RepID=UPI0012D39533|nr:hypothetical protein [Catellatospora vulcania]
MKKIRLLPHEAHIVRHFIPSSVLHSFLTDHDAAVARMGNGAFRTEEFSASSGPKGISYTFAPRPQSQRVEDKLITWQRLRKLFASVPQELADALLDEREHPHTWSRWERMEPIAKRIFASVALGGRA